MMKCKHPRTKLTYQFSLEDYIPKDHFLRIVDEVVDFGLVRDLVREFYSDRGARSVDPVVIFKMSLLGYFYGISSKGGWPRNVGTTSRSSGSSVMTSMKCRPTTASFRRPEPGMESKRLSSSSPR